MLAKLPVFRVPLTVKASDHYNPGFFYQKKDPVRKAMYSCTVPACIYDSKALRPCKNRLDSLFYRLGETHPELGTNALISRKRLSEFCISLREPNDWQCHRFLNRSALTCSQGITPNGFCS